MGYIRVSTLVALPPCLVRWSIMLFRSLAGAPRATKSIGLSGTAGASTGARWATSGSRRATTHSNWRLNVHGQSPRHGPSWTTRFAALRTGPTVAPRGLLHRLPLPPLHPLAHPLVLHLHPPASL